MIAEVTTLVAAEPPAARTMPVPQFDDSPDSAGRRLSSYNTLGGIPSHPGFRVTW